MSATFDLNEMKIFVAVVRAGSFSAAARKLNIPKPTVSRKVAHLEQSLSTRLLQRTTRRLSLTESGVIYFERCSRILDDIEEANFAVTLLQEKPHGTLRISTSIVFGVAIVNRWLTEFLALYPDIKAEVLIANRNINLVAERIDLCFRAGPLEDSSLVSRLVSSICYWLCASPKYLALHSLPQEPQDLVQQDCLEIVNENFLEHPPWVFKQGTREVVVSIQSRIRVNDHLFAREIVLRGEGIALLPDILVEEDINAGQLVRLLPEWENRQREIYIVYSSEQFLAPKVKAFVDFVCQV
jgi:DNA-binding transcriptional LysR family regulator